jgi:site-specific recombinase XerD
VYAPAHLTDSENTLKSYQVTLGKYLGFLEDDKGFSIQTISAECFEKQVIEEWMRHMRNIERLSPDTCNIRLGGLRTYLKYLGTREVKYKYLYSEAIDIPLMKTEKKKVSGLSKKAVKTLMTAPNQSTPAGRRDLVFMIIAYGTAARMSEILSIKVGHLFLDGSKPHVTVIGKGGKVRTLYLLPKAVAHIRKYLNTAHGENPDPERYLFYSRNGNKEERISSKAIEKRLRMYAEKAHEKCSDVPLDLHAHQFRHARASHWLEEGMNIVEISVLLGHEQLATTMRYLDISTDDQIKAMATLEDENDSKVSAKWKNNNGSLKSLVARQ